MKIDKYIKAAAVLAAVVVSGCQTPEPPNEWYKKLPNPEGHRVRLVLFIIVALQFSTVAYSATQLPSFSAPYDFGIGKRIESLAAVAGPDWREVAEKNRKPELKYLSKAQIIALMQKYADKGTGDVGGEPLDEMPEISEASFRAGDFCFPYGIALWRHFFESKVPVRDKVTAAKLLNGFERTFAGVVPKDDKGEKVEFSPRWLATHFQNGKYSTPLPGGGYFESSWTNSQRSLCLSVKTSAKFLDCHVMPMFFMAFRKVVADGKDIEFGRSAKGCDFSVELGENGMIDIEMYHSLSWPAPRTKK